MTRNEEEYEDGLRVTGFDLRAALKSESLSETRGHLRALYDLVSLVSSWNVVVAL